MYKSGNGHTKQQVTEMVKKILDKDSLPNPGLLVFISHQE